MDAKDLMRHIHDASYTIDPANYQMYNVKRGLRNSDGTGVIVGLTSVGDVSGYIIDDNEKIPTEGRLRYRGINVATLVENCIASNRFGFEETCYLLLFGYLPTESQLQEFSELLAQLRPLPDGFIEDMILKAPSGNIMNKLARSVLALYSYDDNPDELSFENVFRQSVELIARFPSMIAYALQAKEHYYNGKSLFIHQPKTDGSTAENFLHLIRADNKYSDLEAKILDLCLILHAEHGGGNNSTFTTHVVSSSGTDTYSAIAASVGSLKGSKHGGANIKVMAMMDEMKNNVSDWRNKDEVASYIEKIINKEAFDRTGLVYGLGHAIYTISDPRAVLLKKYAKSLAEESGHAEEFALYELVERLTPDVFSKIKGDSKIISANVDFYSGLVYRMLNIPDDLFTPIFAMARISGWCAHRLEEVFANGRIIRPAYKSISVKSHYVPIEEREVPFNNDNDKPEIS